MPDLGPNKRAVRIRPVMVVLRGYDPTQPNKTSFLAPPKTFTSTDPDFIWSGMAVRRLPDGTTVPAVAADFTTIDTTDRPKITSSQIGWAFQDSNRFDIVQSRLANNFSARSDGEIRTGWFDRSKVYKIDDALTIGAKGELTLVTNNEAIVGRVSALPKFEGGNPRIGNVSYNYASTLPAIPTSPTIAEKATFNAAVNAWITGNGVTHAAFAADRGTDSSGVYPNDDAVAAAYLLAVAFVEAQVLVRQAASDISSLQALDNSMLTFVTARL